MIKIEWELIGKFLFTFCIIVLFFYFITKKTKKAVKTYQKTAKPSSIFGTKKEWLIVGIVLLILFGSIFIALSLLD